MTLHFARRCGAFSLALLLTGAALFFLTNPSAVTVAATDSGEVNLYAYREPALIKPLIEAFEKDTGLKVNVIFAKSGLIERMQAEGKQSPADVLLTNEFGLLTQAKAAGVTAPINSSALQQAIPPTLRGPDNHWFAFTRRARVIYASRDRVKEDHLTYEDLAKPAWKGRVCIRSGQHTYNIALIASMIAHHGEEATKNWLIGLRNNLARRPAGGDREGVKDVAAGLCDVAIGNTYYMAAMQKNPDQKAWADAVRLIFPNSEGRGTHVNISGAALARQAPNRDNGIRFIEYLASKPAQAIYAEILNEYPVVEGVPISKTVASWGTLKADSLDLQKISELRSQASRLVDEVNFDAGPQT
jgi:iron(III) transport system substrate-binding protein